MVEGVLCGLTWRRPAGVLSRQADAARERRENGGDGGAVDGGEVDES